MAKTEAPMRGLTRTQILDRIDKLAVWSRASERAPHKPLLILYALGRLQRGLPEEVAYTELEGDLRLLLQEFGPARKTDHPEYPFWRLQTSGLWEVVSDREVRARRSNSDPPRSELLGANARGRFTDEVVRAFRSNGDLVGDVAQRLLDGHFAETYHADILDVVGLDADRAPASRRRRDPQFRAKVLTAYEYRCAVCGLDLRLGSRSVALEAAHIMWHQAGGPDVESNGLCLCSLHHKLFDRGVFTVAEGTGDLLASEEAVGSGDFEHALLRHHGRPICQPQRPEARPALRYLAWHRRLVFRERPRHLPSHT